MSFSDLYDNGFKKRNDSHFASIVRVAMANGAISDDEKAFLDRLARKLDISDEDYKAILKNYNAHPINPPSSYDRRLERLYDLVRMVYVDQITDEGEYIILEKIAIGLGFNYTNVKYIIDKALALVAEGVDLDAFMEEIKLMNR